MKKLRSYSSIWKVEQVIHSFGDAKPPIPMTVTQIIWFYFQWNLRSLC